MAPSIIYPDGFELREGRGADKAKAAMDLAEERGYDRSAVRTVREGYLVPVGDDAQAPGENLLPSDPNEVDGGDGGQEAIVEEITLPTKKDEIIAFAKDNGIDLGDASNNEQRLEAIKAEIQRRTDEAEATGVLTPAGGEANSIEQADGDDAQNSGEPAGDDTPQDDQNAASGDIEEK